MTKNSTRSTRLEARLSPETLATVKRAAEIEGRSVSDFVVAAARQAAQRTIAETQVLHLALADQKGLAAALGAPPKRRRGFTGATGLRRFRTMRPGCFCRWRRRGKWWRGEWRQPVAFCRMPDRCVWWCARRRGRTERRDNRCSNTVAGSTNRATGICRAAC
ncbi:MAG TPA: DUF1778 domain-containing protein [Bradyrhizobium sp.]|nr:DUF1778 domain-containing protein [Bradyrhizobium sp.]